MDLNLKNHVVVVTGGGSGIGRASAATFAAEGANVAIWDLGDSAKRAAEEIQGAFPVRAIGISADVTDESVVLAATEQTTKVLGPINHLVHAAGVGSGKFGFPFTNLRPEDWLRVLQVNVMGMVHVAHAIAPRDGGTAKWNDGVCCIDCRADRLANRSALQRVKGRQHQLCAVYGKRPCSQGSPCEHGLPRNGPDTSEPVCVAGLA